MEYKFLPIHLQENIYFVKNPRKLSEKICKKASEMTTKIWDDDQEW